MWPGTEKLVCTSTTSSACVLTGRELVVALSWQSRKPRRLDGPRGRYSTSQNLCAEVLASAAFVFTMLKDPPKSVASDPTKLTIQPLDIKIQTGIPTGEYGAAAN